MKTIKKQLALLFILLSVGCDVSNENLILSYFDSDDKSITLTSGTDPLILGVKKSFIRNDWQVLTFDENVDQENISFSEIDTRYIMLSDYNQGEDLFYGPFVQDYEFTIYDTDSGFEVVILYGSQRTVKQVLNEFKQILTSNY